MGEKWGGGGGQGYFKLAKRGGGLLLFSGTKIRGEGSYDSARFIRSQFKKVRLLNQLDRMEYKIKIFKTLIL